jgi:hypothetical protein
MPWKGVTVHEERLGFLQEYRLDCYSVSDLADRFSISHQTAHTHPGHQGKWIRRLELCGRTASTSSPLDLTAPRRRPTTPPPRSWSTFGKLTLPGVPASCSTSCGGGRLPGSSLHPPPPAASFAEKDLSAPGGASDALTPALPSPFPRGPTTSACTCGAAQVGGRLQGPVPAEERQVLLPPDGERPVEPLSLGLRRPPNHLARALAGTFPAAV